MERERSRDEQLKSWRDEHDIDIERLDEGQKWIVFIALRVLAVIGDVAPLRRILTYFLVHSGLELGSKLIGALMATSGRSVRYHRSRTAEDLWKRVSNPVRGHRAPKLGPGIGMLAW